MPILKTATTPNGAALAYHRPIRLEVDFAANIVMVHVASFIDEAGFIAGKPRAWVWYVTLPVSGTNLSAVETTLTTDASSPFSGGAIVTDATDTLEAVKSRKYASLSESCHAQIVGGFTSSALGAAYSYPAKPLDQSNLTGSVLASILPGNAATWTTPFWCADSTGAWAFRTHSAAQIQQVGNDAKAALLTALNKNQTLGGQVSAATTIAAVNAVVW